MSRDKKSNTVSTEKHGDGNTKGRHRGWQFTYNNYEKDDITQLLSIFKMTKAEYVFQEETGEEGTEHLQGFVYWENARTFIQVKHINSKWHIEVAKDWIRLKTYCTKFKTRTGDIFTNMEGIEVVERPKIVLKGWQSKIVGELQRPADTRSIIWCYDLMGACGKSTFCKWLFLTHGSNKVGYITSGKGGDMKHYVAKKKPKIVLFDFARSREDRIDYGVIEEIKNGLFFTGKYDSTDACFNNPHIYIFANFKPDLEAMTKDRWDIRCVSDYRMTHAGDLIKVEEVGGLTPPSLPLLLFPDSPEEE